MVRSCVAGLMLCLLSGILSGCGASGPAPGTDSEIKKVGILYLRFLGNHRGKSPADRAELAAFLDSMSDNEKKTIGIRDGQDIFKSSRDGRDLVIRYGIPVPPPGPGQKTVVAYEQKGVGGKHLVVYGNAGVEELPQAKLKELVPDASL